MKLLTMNLVKRGGFLFKVSVNVDTEVIMVHVYNSHFFWSHIRFFTTEAAAHDWVEYLLMQERNLTDLD